MPRHPFHSCHDHFKIQSLPCSDGSRCHCGLRVCNRSLRACTGACTHRLLLQSTYLAQPLAQALNELARQSGFQLLVQRNLVEDRLAPAIEGRLTVQQALARLLAGSGLEAAVDDNTIVIKRSPSVSVKESILPAVTVTAAAETALATRQEKGFRAKGTAVSGFREQEVLNTPFPQRPSVPRSSPTSKPSPWLA